MKFDITKAQEGVTYDFSGSASLPPDMFADRNIKIDGDAAVSGCYTVIDDTVGVKIRVEFALNGLCDKCLAPFALSFRKTVSPTFLRTIEDDCYWFDGNQFDLTQPIVDTILLATPQKLLCSSGCKGLCPKCGADLNQTQCDCINEQRGRNNPFYQLKSLIGGAEDGITQK